MVLFALELVYRPRLLLLYTYLKEHLSCRPWHDTRAIARGDIARAHAVTHANQEKGGLGGQ